MLRPSISIRLQQYRIEAVAGFYIGYNELNPESQPSTNTTRVSISKVSHSSTHSARNHHINLLPNSTHS